MITLSRDLLERSPEETSRRLCLSLWGEAEAALGRLERGEDGEALHDFRVALRRLRSVLRAYRSFLRGSRPRKLRRLVGALASSTNLARDVEVQLEWLEARGNDPAQKLHAHLTTKRVELPTPEALRKHYDQVGKTLEGSLARMKLARDVGGETFLAATGKLLAERGTALKSGLDAIASAEEAEKLHRTRIQAKRLRYLLEPLQKEVRRTRPLIKKMKGLQDCLGELQDTRVMTETIANALEGVALDEARRLRDEALGRGAGASQAEEPAEKGDDGCMTSAGLYELLEAQRERRDAAFATLSETWLGDSAQAFFDELEAVAERLGTRATRVFLLSGLPEPVAGTAGVTVHQGWISGKNIHEHLRSERRGRRTRYVRTVEISGRATEETLTRGAFEALWPITEGHRLEHRLYEVGACTIDIVEEKNLVLAYTETLPDWLHPWVLREVTGSKRYALESVMRARSAPEKPADPLAGTR